ncbi:MFS transporter [Georgenia daeguensis]|uniref:MFS transporter n=1 Tax=Georgenia daeguensis TaxID=908355 RepID=A0ABP8EYL8_9MICO
MSAPGQTAAISVFTDSLIAELGISRNALSTGYLIGTLAGAAAMPLVGRALDRFGVGRVMAVIAAIFGAVLLAMSVVTEIVGLTAGFVGIRMAGQGALGLAASTAVAVHVTRRRGLALGVTSAVGSGGISLAPVVLERLISHHGMATAWRVEGLVVWAVVIPLALIVFGRRPRATIPAPDGRGPQVTDSAAGRSDGAWTAGEALRTPMFWVIAAGLAASGMLSTGLNFHQIAVLGERGLTPAQAALNFVPQAVTTMTVTIAIGALADRFAPKLGLVISMALLAGSLLMLPVLDSGWTALVYGGLLGAAGGTVRTVEVAAYSYYFGTAHIGAIRGVSTTVSVGSTAFGPLALSLGAGLTGSYATAATLLAAVPAAVIVLALVVRPPARRRSAETSDQRVGAQS